MSLVLLRWKLLLQIWTSINEIHKLINSIWSKEDLPDQYKEYIIVPIYKDDKTL
jgi:hypothetical protein